MLACWQFRITRDEIIMFCCGMRNAVLIATRYKVLLLRCFILLRSLFFHMPNLETCLSAPIIHWNNVLFNLIEHGMHAHMPILGACPSAPFIKTCAWQNPGGCLLCQGRQQPDPKVCALTYSFCPISAYYS